MLMNNFYNFINLHFIVGIFACTQYFISKQNEKIYCDFHDTLAVNVNLISHLKFITRAVVIEEAFFRVYLNEFLGHFFENTHLHLISSICFSLCHMHNYFEQMDLELRNIKLIIIQVIYSFILSYYYFQHITPLYSLLLHAYANITSTLILSYIYKKSNYKKSFINQKNNISNEMFQKLIKQNLEHYQYLQ